MSGAIGLWIDGVRADALPADDRGLHYGDGLFETILVRAGRARFLDLHLARLSLGCTRLAIRFEAMRELRAEIETAAAQAPTLAVLKIIVTRGSALRRGYAPAGAERARRLLSLWHTSGLSSPAEGADLIVAALNVAENPALAGIKHLNRLENVLAAAESVAAGSYEALMLDARGHLICGAMSNVFLVHAGRVATPRVNRCGVAGVMRSVVLRECAVLGLETEERLIMQQELLAADEVFITNARIGVVPVRRVGEHSYHMNTIARRLEAHIGTLDA
jgi:4-amino-4-deoxychorismate lyase